MSRRETTGKASKTSRKIREKLGKGKVDKEKTQKYSKEVNRKLLELKTELEGISKYLKNAEKTEARSTRKNKADEVNKNTKEALSESAAETFLSILPGGMAGAIGAEAKREDVSMKEVAERFKESQIKKLNKETKESRIQVDAANKTLKEIKRKSPKELKKNKKELNRKVKDLKNLKKNLEKVKKS